MHQIGVPVAVILVVDVVPATTTVVALYPDLKTVVRLFDGGCVLGIVCREVMNVVIYLNATWLRVEFQPTEE